jgi:hypothetical protein
MITKDGRPLADREAALLDERDSVCAVLDKLVNHRPVETDVEQLLAGCYHLTKLLARPAVSVDARGIG